MTIGNITALVETLVSVGATPEQILAAVRIAEGQKDAALEASREKARARVQNWRERNKPETVRNVTERSVADTSRLTRGDARGEDNLLPRKITGQEENKKESRAKALSDVEAFKADLMHDASSEQVEAFVKHRKAKNGQNSAYAAKLFRRDAAACSLSVSGAIDMAVSRGWLTVKPEYLNGSRQGNAQAPPGKRPNPIEAYETIARERGWTNESEILPSHHDNVEFLPPEPVRSSGAVVDLRSGVGRRFGPRD